jgi:16S rRNA (cytosine1402-N4)-methyltransferase
MSIHVPVLLKEVIEILDPKPGEFFIDGTVGSGGHALEILEKIGPKGKLLGIDLDQKQLEKTYQSILRTSDVLNIKNNFGTSEVQKLKIKDTEIILVQGNYADLPEILKKNNLPKADGLLLDLGFSSEQLESGRGFSFMKDEPLDIRYSVYQEIKNQKSKIKNLTAAEIINSFSEKELAEIFWKYGEEKFSRRIARKIIEERRKKRILTTFDLVEVIKKAVAHSNDKRIKTNKKRMIYERGRIHLATRVFQALRIYVNDELGNLERLLKNLSKIIRMGAFGLPKPEAEARYSDALGIRMGAFGLPKPQAEARYSDAKGRAAIISFHSLEDRLVKNYFREMAKQGKAEILTKKPIRPSFEEIKQNPRARSAKLRAVVLK